MKEARTIQLHISQPAQGKAMPLFTQQPQREITHERFPRLFGLSKMLSPMALKIDDRMLTRVPAAELDSGVTHMGDALAVVLIAQVHTVGVTITAPTHGDA